MQPNTWQITYYAAGALAAVVGIAIAVREIVVESSPDSDVKIGAINSRSSTEFDYVELLNSGNSAIDGAGYRVCERDRGGSNDNCCLVPAGHILQAGARTRMYFSGTNKHPENRAKADVLSEQGQIVCDFGIQSGEIVELSSPTGDVVDKKTAR